MIASQVWQRIVNRTAAVAKRLAIKLHIRRAGKPIPAMIGTPPSKRSPWHDLVDHAKDFAERYAKPMNYHVENRMIELGIPTDRIGARNYGYPLCAFLPEETTGGGNVPGRRLNVDSGVTIRSSRGSPVL